MARDMQAIHLTSFLSSSQPFTTLLPITIPSPNPKPNEILVKITHVSLQQVDLLYARGRHQNNNAKRGHVHPPFTLGLDFSGIVVSTPESRAHTPPPSSGRSSFEPGDKVFGSSLGAFATYLTCSPTTLRHLPPTISPAQGAALSSGVVSLAALDVADVKPHHNVLVSGVPGALAVVAAQLAAASANPDGRASQCGQVFALARNDQRVRAIQGSLPGVTVLASDSDWQSSVREATDGKGVDVVIDNVGLVKDSLSVLSFGGTVVLVGFAGRQGVMEAVDMNRVLLKGAKVMGFRFGEGIRNGVVDGEECWKRYLRAIEQGTVRAVVDEKCYRGLGDVGRAMEDLERGMLVGKAVICLEQDDRSKL